jgi:RND family efflux transporter MFP subunit
MDLQVQTVQSQVVSTKASQNMTTEADKMSLMTAAYTLERAKLEASKAEIVSNIEKEKARIDVGTAEGSLDLTRASVNAHQVSAQTDLQRLQTNIETANRNMERVKGYVSNMVLRAPVDGVVNILSNFRSGGDFGSAGVPFREGDTVPTGMAIAEIPDLSKMRVEVRLDEVDRGKVQLGQAVKVRVDAIPDREFDAVLDWISPIATLLFRGTRDSDKQFPAYATLASVDPRLRPGMSASIDIIVDSQPNVLLIPIRASFTQNGKPNVYIQNGDQFKMRPIEVGAQNEDEIVVTGGLKEGELVTQEDPKEAAKRAKKKL